MIQKITTYLVSRPGAMMVARCTKCRALTLQPTRPMLDRDGVLICDGCGDCPPNPVGPTPTNDGAVFTVHAGPMPPPPPHLSR